MCNNIINDTIWYQIYNLEDKMKQRIWVMLDDCDYKAIQAISEYDGLPISAAIRRIIKMFLREQEKSDHT